jgi:hypothetical protein
MTFYAVADVAEAAGPAFLRLKSKSALRKLRRPMLKSP